MRGVGSGSLEPLPPDSPLPEPGGSEACDPEALPESPDPDALLYSHMDRMIIPLALTRRGAC